jgi:hypothetical protein
MILPVGCGEPGAQQSNIPTDFAKKLEAEKPDIFIKKSGKKTEALGGRDKRAAIRQEQDKERNQGAP